MTIEVFAPNGDKIDTVSDVTVEDKGTHYLVKDTRHGYDLYIRSYHKNHYTVMVVP